MKNFTSISMVILSVAGLLFDIQYMTMPSYDKAIAIVSELTFIGFMFYAVYLQTQE